MTDRADTGEAEVSIVAADEADGTSVVEAYETEDTTVLYEAANPLAWIEASETVRIDDVA